MKSKTILLVVCSLTLALSAGYAAAANAPGPDTFKVSWFVNANTTNVPDGSVYMTNPGTAGGNLCANIFVFDPDQELSECGACLLSPTGLRTLSVNKDLTGNPLTGVTLTTGVIYTVSSPTVNGTCPLPDYPLSPVAGIRSGTATWDIAMNVSSAAGVSFSLPEVSRTPSQDATLSATELRRLQNQCYAIALDGSGRGILTCGTGD
jgi:hypothetical protein